MNAATLLELLRQRERNALPLIVLHSPLLLGPADGAVEAACKSGRAVFHVRFVRSDGNGCLKLDCAADTLSAEQLDVNDS